MNELDKKIWELFGSPTKKSYVAIQNSLGEFNIGGGADTPLDIGLAHVMQLLVNTNYIRVKRFDNDPDHIYFFDCRNISGETKGVKYRYKNEKNEAAPLRDQTEETKLAIIKLVNGGKYDDDN